MRRHVLSGVACLCLAILAVTWWISRSAPPVTDASGGADTAGRQAAPDEGPEGPLQKLQTPVGQDSGPGAPAPAPAVPAAEKPQNGAGSPSAAAAEPAPAGSSTTAGPNGAPVNAPAGGNSKTKAPASNPTAPPQAAPAVPRYSVEEFYHWQWSPQTRSPVPWSFTSSVPTTWRSPISTAANTWNAEQRSLQYAAPGADIPAYPPNGCDTKQLDTNGVHRTSLDGPNGIVATTYSCVDANTAEAVSIQVVIDADDRWFTGNGPSAPGDYDLIGAVSHEFGHATGWEGHYAPADPRCTDTAPERMCPALLPGSTAWRTSGPTDRAIFGSAY